MKIKAYLLFILITVFLSACEKEEITSIDDIIGTWTSELAEVRVVKNGDEAWITYIKVEYDVTYGMNTSFSCGGCNIEINSNDFTFDYNYSDDSYANGEFKSPDKLVLKGKVDGNSVRYVLSK
jgi:hypothetical protein